MFSCCFCGRRLRQLFFCVLLWNLDGWVAILNAGSKRGQVLRFDKAGSDFKDTLDVVLHLCDFDRRVHARNALLEPGLIRWDLVTQLALFVFWCGTQSNLHLEFSDAIGSLLAVGWKLLALAPAFLSGDSILNVYLGDVEDHLVLLSVLVHYWFSNWQNVLVYHKSRHWFWLLFLFLLTFLFF